MLMSATPQILLASASPRRRELLDQIGLDYRVAAVVLNESPLTNEAAEPYVMRLAAEKSLRAWQMGDGLPVLAADTAVVLDDHILGKPIDKAHALAMLGSLSGRRHRVLTAVSLRCAQHRLILSETLVQFRKLSGREIEAYWNTGEPCDKAGAYAIQGRAAQFVERIEGSYSGVVGLPLFETAQLLRQAGIGLLTEIEIDER